MSDKTTNQTGGTVEELSTMDTNFKEVKNPEPPPQKEEEKGADSYARKVFKTDDGKLDADKLADAYDELYKKFSGDLAGLKDQVGKTAEVSQKLETLEERLSAVTSLEEKMAQVLERLESRGGAATATDDETEEAIRSAGIEPDSEEGKQFRNFLEYYNSEFDPEGAYKMFKKELEQHLNAAKPSLSPEWILEAVDSNPDLQKALAEKLADPIHQTIQQKEMEQRAQQEIKQLVDQGNDEATVYAAVAFGAKKGANGVMEAWEMYQKYLSELADKQVTQQIEKEAANQLRLRQELPKAVDGSGLNNYEEVYESPFKKVLEQAKPKSELY